MTDDLNAFIRQLRWFATDAGLAVALEQGGRITPAEAYRRIKRRYKSLRAMYRDLEDGLNPGGDDGR
jgi:hypothetical protein